MTVLRIAIAAAALVLALPAHVFAQHPHAMPMPRDTVSRDTIPRDTTHMKHVKRDSMPGMDMPGMTMPAASTARATSSAPANHDMQSMHDMRAMMTLPLGVPQARMGSGTSWMPDSTVMHARHLMLGPWTAMLHGVAFAQYDDQASERGDRQFGIVDWEMLMLMRRIGAGELQLHGMVSLEPLTLGGRGYPLLLQTGEAYHGEPLHDRQHPHDAFMELAAIYQRPITRTLGIELYGGPVGEPALGPVAFMHRPSAQSDPLAPLGHHWQDATHVSFGVVTAGVYSHVAKLEASVFNGREPDDNRWNFDFHPMNAYSTRLTVNPTGRTSVAAWYGYLPSPEALHPAESVHRYGASALVAARGIDGGSWASTVVWGANESAGHARQSVLAESNLEIGARNSVFARVERVRKSAEELVLPSIDPTREFDVGSIVGGYVREVATFPGGTIGIGGRVSLNFVPDAIAPFYGTRRPVGFDVYLRVRPSAERGGM